MTGMDRATLLAFAVCVAVLAVPLAVVVIQRT